MTAFLKLIRQAPWSARFGMVVIATYAVLAIFAPVLTPFGESEIVASEFEPWGEDYILSTDNLGRIVDVLMAIPQLIFALLILTIAGTSIPVLIIVIALLDSTRVFRLARAVAMNIVVMDFVEVARLRGEGLWWVMHREVLPNAMPPLVAEFGLRFCFVFLFISALSFLGLGVMSRIFCN